VAEAGKKALLGCLKIAAETANTISSYREGGWREWHFLKA
jgi:hypothetical protein